MEKLRAERILLRNEQLVITNAAQLVTAIQTAAPPLKSSATSKYSFRLVEEMPALDRVASHLRPAVPVKGIMKLHYFGVQDGTLKAKAVSYLECLEGNSEECASCAATLPIRTAFDLW